MRNSSLTRLLKLPLRESGRLKWFLATSIAFAAFNAVTPLVTENAIRILDTQASLPWMRNLCDIDNKRDALLLILGLAAVALMGKCTCMFLQRYLQGWLTNRIVMGVQDELADHLLGLDLGYFKQERTGELMSRMTNDLGLLRKSLKLLSVLITRPLILIATLGVTLHMSWRLTLLGLVAAPLGGIFVTSLSRKMRRAARRSLERRADLTSVMVQFLMGVRVVKAFLCEKFEARQFHGENRRLFGALMKYERARARTRPIVEFVAGLGGLVVIYVGGEWVFGHKIDVSKLVGFLTALGVMYNPAKELSRANNELQEALPGADRVFQIMDMQAEVREGDARLECFQREISIRDLHFAYIPGKPVLHAINLEIRHGECVALVGPSGAGKSTLTDLLLRFYDPQQGKITIDGIDLRDLTFASLRGQFALICQDPFLFNCSLKENIAYGRDDATMDAIERAARAANIHDEIMAMPRAYDTMAGERGGNLSGGQRQRMAIARAIFKDAPILIMDEATSSLDSVSELQVKEALDRLMRNRTSIIIAHRLSTIRHADRIVVMEQGRITAIGSHDELMRNSPTYSRLVDLQNT